jgi:hypothetical protein
MRARVSPPEVSPHAGWSGARILLGERLLEVHLLKAAGALEADAPKTSKLARIRERALSTAAMAQVAVPFIELLLPGIPLLRSTSEAGVLSAFVASCFEREGRTWTPQFDHVVAILIARLREAGELHQGEPVGSLLAALQKRGDKRLHMRFEVERLAEQSFRSTFQMPDGELLEGPSRRSKAQAKQAVATLALQRILGHARPKKPDTDDTLEFVADPCERDGNPHLRFQRVRDFDGAMALRRVRGEKLQQWFIGKFAKQPWVALQLLSRHTAGTWVVEGWQGTVSGGAAAVVRLTHGEESWTALAGGKSRRKALYAASRDVAAQSSLDDWLQEQAIAFPAVYIGTRPTA